MRRESPCDTISVRDGHSEIGDRSALRRFLRKGVRGQKRYGPPRSEGYSMLRAASTVEGKGKAAVPACSPDHHRQIGQGRCGLGGPEQENGGWTQDGSGKRR